ncbi:hypothetical protein, conserved [Babesia bigemina]|uniref:Macro domain-containing protein n=1 Tax=Babesia bigemina TaxID=5866 RepID=A0A061DD02_BABBI|nr:hypothetical protein, conserved [Babesia bigemina]CDR98107.1 hypothetical protein, conserved [Babesia bigemina]|eukprot:XP_012770293.1 hypothetical protein, conserved [Babesia bigemina]
MSSFAIVYARYAAALSRYNCPSAVKHFGTGSFLQSRLKTIRERAIEQQIDWIKSAHVLNSTTQNSGCSPRVHSLTRSRQVCNVQGTPDDTAAVAETSLKPLTGLFSGVLEKLELGGFGTISAEHDDILNINADCILVPVPPNLTPYSGFGMCIMAAIPQNNIIGLNVLERGGKKLIEALVKRAKVVVAERLKALDAVRSQFETSQKFEEAVAVAKTLNIGDVILTPPFGTTKATIIGFVITPFFWGMHLPVVNHISSENSTRDATLKLRFAFKTALEHINRMHIQTIVCPTLTDALSGYEPRNAAVAMIEEAYDVMTQVDAIKPLYGINCLRLVHRSLPEARQIANAIVAVAHTRRPEYKFDESVLKFCSKPRKITYKSHKVVRNSKRIHWLRNIKPFLWRNGLINVPPPLLVHKATGQMAMNQLRPVPFYKDRVTHVLFPLMRSSYKRLKMGSSGHWLGTAKQEPVYTQSRAL